jgi:hypothetical protein
MGRNLRALWVRRDDITGPSPNRVIALIVIGALPGPVAPISALRDDALGAERAGVTEYRLAAAVEVFGATPRPTPVAHCARCS